MSKMARIRITLFILNLLNILDILLPNASRTTKKGYPQKWSH